ncbi:MAG: DnaJ C-terminal domain-containing protein [Pseudomonadota bacterium]
MPNPYSVLGVSKSADEKAIKSAFRKLAKKYHPDQNKDDKNAQAKFAEINQAYEILGDKNMRAQFDRGEIDETGKPKFAGFEGAGGDPFSSFRQGAGGHGANPFGSGGFDGAEDVLKEFFGSAFGGQQRSGGFGGGNPFGNAGGMGGGGQRNAAPSLDVEMKAAVSVEDLLRGKAFVTMPNGKQISVSIPPESGDGKVIRLKGQGNSTPGRKSGDALITIVVKKTGKFQKHGVDIRTDAPLPLKTAVLGGKVAVETLDGKLSLNIPSGTSSGKIFRLKGKGLPKKDGGFGDLLVSASIQLPDEDLETLVQFFNSQ